ncbi:MAG: tryptophan synthase subunit alpha [Planctomycetota bacterium]|jgi:tryptophan synthase alpha chain|nr:tryptophan synthase subunit alpha [Blastopirellula sp.]
MNRYERMFAGLTTAGRVAFVPFTVLGFPDLVRSEAWIEAMIASGADALELGIPFSDPLADGPTIQRAMAAALDAGVSPDDCLRLVDRIRQRHPELPIGLLMYANLVWARGPARFFSACAASGVDSVLIADVPLDESDEFLHQARSAGVGQVFLCPPNIDERRMKLLAERGFGYTYLLSRAGVTGSEVAAGSPVAAIVARLRELGAPPPLLGFGISRPEQVAAAAKEGAAGVICGSKVIELMLAEPNDLEAVSSRLGTFVRSMVSASKFSPS